MRKFIFILIIGLLLFGCGKSQKESARYTEFDDVISSGKPLAMEIGRASCRERV